MDLPVGQASVVGVTGFPETLRASPTEAIRNPPPLQAGPASADKGEACLPFSPPRQVCFKYFCRSCWHWRHSAEGLHHHSPLMRNQKNRDSS